MIESDKTNAISNIFYEAQMIKRSYTEYWKPDRCKYEVWIHNSILEATLLHIRALIDFFEKSRGDKTAPRNDDVLAEDYSFPVTIFSFPVQTRTFINTRIAHISYKRSIDTSFKDWNVESLIPPIIYRSNNFFTHLRERGHLFPKWPTDGELQVFLNETKNETL